jgi:hypothetical protein
MTRECNMYGCNDYEDDDKCKSNKKSILYKSLITIIVLIGQIIGIINAYNSNVSFGIYLLFRLCFLKSALDYNIIDCIYNFKRTLKVIGNSKKISFILMFVFYVIGTIIAIGIIIFTHTYDLIEVKNIGYIQNDEKWISDNYTKYNIPQFCFTTGTVDTMYKTADFAFMATLPRLYEKYNNTCRIKPSMRGVFNTSMKYIFGPNYMEQGITIYCYPHAHDPYLVITSELLFEEVKNTVADIDEYEVVPNVTHYESIPFFDVDTLCQDGIAQDQCSNLKSCISTNSQCKEEWGNYTNAYWESYTSNKEFKEYANYEITIPSSKSEYNLEEKDKFHFFPTLMKRNNSDINITGQHFVVGGGFEDIWGFSFLAEIGARTYFPLLFESIIPFYAIYGSVLPEFFKENELHNSDLFAIVRNQQDEHNHFRDIVSKFLFNITNLYTIGHSISSATMKGFVATNNIPGITFDTMDTNTLAITTDKTIENEDMLEAFENARASKMIENVGEKRSNVYSDGAWFSSVDDSYEINGKLPKIFKNPNVYDTACLTAAVCSETKKYVPLCQQVLNQHGNDPIKKFQEILDAVGKSL